MGDERAYCVGCGHLVGRVTDRATEKQRAAIDTGHRKFCNLAAELAEAIRYASVDDNDDPDPTAVLAGAATAYLDHMGAPVPELLSASSERSSDEPA
jgi:hypothetical protein